MIPFKPTQVLAIWIGLGGVLAGCHTKDHSELKSSLEHQNQTYRLVGVSSPKEDYKKLKSETSYWHFGDTQLTIYRDGFTQVAEKPSTETRPDALHFGPIGTFTVYSDDGEQGSVLAGSDLLVGQSFILKQWPKQLKAFLMVTQEDGHVTKELELTFEATALPTKKFKLIEPKTP